MKNFSLKTLLGTLVLAIAGVVLWNTSAQVFAATDYLSFAPAGCDTSIMTVFYVTGGNSSALTAGGILANTIVVVDAGTYSMVGDLTMGSCGVLVTNGDVAGNVVLDFPLGKSIISNTVEDIVIRGFNATHRLELIGTTNALGIKLQNVSGATISYTTLSGFTLLGGIGLINTKYSNISYNTITNNKYGVILYSTSTDNIIDHNTITNNIEHGMWIYDNSNNTTISDNTINNNTGHGIYLEGLLGTHISSNDIQYNSRGIYMNSLSGSYISSNNTQYNSMGIYVNIGQNNDFSNNTVTNNSIGIGLNNTKTNTFNNNTIDNNTNWGLALQSTSSGNTFTGGSISSNTNTNVYFSDSHYNILSSISIQSSLVGMQINDSTYNIFDNVNVTSNTSGTKLSTSSNNTIELINNNNEIYIDNNSNYNSILNTQIPNQNNIFIFDGSSNNTITGGLFTSPSTTNTSVRINLKNSNALPVYSITGSGLTGIYLETDMTGLTGTTIQLSDGNGNKDIIVTYNNGNKQYDSIVLGTVVTPPTGGGGGGGGGIASCVSSQLVCSGGTRVLAEGSYCQGGSLGLSCSLSGTNEDLPVGSIVGSTYSTEMNNAYLRSYSYGITTMPTIQQAMMGGKLIRSHMAKMISNFAITLGERTPDTSLDCNFNDIANQSEEMKFYIKLSCQLGLMGQGITDFDPKGEVTRGQFATIMSRLIRGSTYDGGTPYYASHLTVLENAGIITNTTHNMKERRGYVMIMMQRTYDGGFLNN